MNKRTLESPVTSFQNEKLFDSLERAKFRHVVLYILAAFEIPRKNWLAIRVTRTYGPSALQHFIIIRF